jgi:hypothetical protein
MKAEKVRRYALVCSLHKLKENEDNFMLKH